MRVRRSEKGGQTPCGAIPIAAERRRTSFFVAAGLVRSGCDRLIRKGGVEEMSRGGKDNG